MPRPRKFNPNIPPHTLTRRQFRATSTGMQPGMVAGMSWSTRERR